LRDGYALALSCRRHDDGLEIELAGSAPYQGFEIEALADRVRRELAALVEHCSQPHAWGYTPSDFSLAALDQATLDRVFEDDREVEDVYPLAPTQAGMLFAHLYARDIHPFFEQASWTLRGALHVGALKLAWAELVERHPALRTYFLWQGLDEPRQVVRRRVEIPWQELDWRDLEPAVQGRQMSGLLSADHRRGLDLARPPLMRLSLVRLADETYQFTWSWHHIILDGWSLTMLTQEGLAIYEAYRQDRDARLEPRKPYRDYVAWLLAQDRAKAEGFWRRKLAGYSAPLVLSLDRQPGDMPGGSGNYQGHTLQLPPTTTDALRALARSQGLTLASIFQGLWGLILRHYSGSDDVVFGITSSGRPAEVDGVDSMVGLFLSTLPARLQIDSATDTRQWLSEVQQQQVELRSFEYSTLVEIQSWSEVPAHQPLFETFLIYQNFPEVSETQWNERTIEVEGVAGFDQATDPLLVLVAPGKFLTLRVSFDCERFEGPGIQRILGQMQAMVDHLIESAEATEAPLSRLPLLRASESHQALHEWNDTEVGLVASLVPSSVPGLYEAQAGRTPDSIALVDGEQAWTYATIDRQANRLAGAIASRGLGAEDVVALLVERGIDFAVALLGVFKAGSAYVPLDSRHPPARRRQILDQSGAELVIASRVHATALDHTLAIGGDAPSPAAATLDNLLATAPQAAAPPHRWAPQGLAYVIYTSGSTGAPKGAMIEHQGMLNHVWDKILRFSLTPGDTVAQTASLTFDISVWQYLSILLAGGRLEVFQDDVAHDPWSLLRAVDDRRVTILETGPTLLGLLLEECDQLGTQKPPAAPLRWLLVSGEALPPVLCRRWLAIYPHVPLLNAYGATECSDDVTHHPVYEPLPAEAVHVPLGFPMPDSTVYILDRDVRAAAIGVPGEIFMGGICVGRGYRGDPTRSAQSFVPDPWAGEPGQRFYRSGDLGRYRNDGNTEFLGRIDFQVKVRGYRIELGEIESVLGEHPAVHQTAVLARDVGPGDPLLVAYVIATEGEDPVAEDLASFVASRLPDYMVPAAFLILESFPLNANGKLDRRALPAPAETGETNRRVLMPRTPTEKRLVEIWREVLDREQLGVDENFFDLGGHSLRAIKVASRVRREFGVEVPMRELFEAPTIAGLAAAVEKAMARADFGSLPLQPFPRDRALPLSFAQHRLWFLDQLEPGSTAYNMNTAVRFSGPIDLGALQLSFSEVVKRHEVLRTTFSAPQGEPIQVIHPPGLLPLPVIDLAGLGEEDKSRVLAGLARAEGELPFDLERGPVLRVGVVRLRDDEHAALAGMHHIASDAWSIEIFEREVRQIYQALCSGEGSPLPPLPIQYADYACWQRRWLDGERFDQELDFWRRQLDGAPSSIALPTDRPHATVRSAAGASVTAPWPEQLSDDLRAVCSRHETTLFMTLLTAFAGLLARYSGERDIVIGTPVAGRTWTEVEDLIGFFVNTLVLRSRIVGDPSFRQLLGEVKEVSLEAQNHQHFPFERLVEELDPERDLSHSPLFQVMFSVQAVDHENDGSGPTEIVETIGGSEPFDLSLVVWDRSRLVVSASYVRDLFDSTTIRRALRHLQALLTSVVAEPDRPLSQWTLMTPGETQQLIGWNDTATQRAADPTIHALIGGQCERTPDSVALITEDRYLSYAGLRRRSRSLARQLRDAGVGPEVRVGLLAERSPERIAALLGILAAGGAYVPLDPSLPQARLAAMVQNAGVRVLVAARRVVDRLPDFAGPTLLLDDATESGSDRPTPAPAERADQLAYVIFTSGSTGRPKGVMNGHRGVVNRLLWLQELRGLRPDDRILQKTPFSFDVSVWEQFWPLTTGQPLIIARPGGHRDATYLARLIKDQRVTLAHFVPSMLSAFLEEPRATECSTLRRILASGEALTPEIVEQFAATFDASLENLYGPTEAAIEVTYHRCRPEPGRLTVPIGRPAPGCRIHLLDRSAAPVSMGVTGELFIGGSQVARGYSQRAGLTAEAFLPDALGGEPGGRLYRSGDLARYRGDGTIEFLGRRDYQVKVRGFRIELGEIEAVLSHHPGVREAVVLALRQRSGELTLAGYLSAEEPAPDSDALVAWLRDRLPEYMIPRLWIPLADLPRTASGKIDRQALARVEPDQPEESTTYVPPRDLSEILLAEIYSDLLGVERVGATSNFFALGGHSLLATRLMSRVRRVFKVDLPLKALFEYPTVATLARAVRLAGRSTAPAPVLVARAGRGPQPLSFAQQRMWFLAQLEPESTAYNLPAAVRFEGELSLSALSAAISEVVRRHQVLRTTYGVVDSQPMQIIRTAQPQSIPLVDVSELPAATRWELAQKLAAQQAALPFDLAQGPVVRLGILRLGPCDHVLLATMHHIASDGWSLGILSREVSVLYDAFRRGLATPLTELPVQYADYAAWQRDWLSGPVLEAEIDYWRQRLAGAPPVLQLPTDRPRPAVATTNGSNRRVALGPRLTEGLQTLSRSAGATLFMTVLAGFDALLARFTGRNDLPVGTPIAGRNHLEVEPLIGFFVNTLVLRVDAGGDPSFEELISRVREISLEAHSHQELPFEKLVEELAPERSLSHTPLFQAFFVLQNLPQEEAGMAELKISELGVDDQTAAFDLSLVLEEGAAGLTGSLEYNRDLFDGTTIRRWVDQFGILLTAAVDDPGKPLSALSVLDAAARHQLVTEWSREADATEELPAGTLHGLVAAQAHRTPEAVALVCREYHVTYGTLQARSSALARRIAALGVEREARVALFLERSPEAIMAMVAVLEAGCAFVPLTISAPTDRLLRILQNAGARAVLTQRGLRDRLPEVVAPLLLIDSPDTSPADRDGRSHRPVDPLQLAYLIFTSGSTGQPKGVMVDHRSIVNYVETVRTLHSLSPRDRLVQFASLSFDLSLEEIFAPLVAGAALAIHDDTRGGSPEAFMEFCAQHSITALPIATAWWHELVACAERLPPGVRMVEIGGEQALPERVAAWQERVGDRCELWNSYGPTEATVAATIHQVARAAARPQPTTEVPIGRPYRSGRVQVLDSKARPVPIGGSGELWLGGAGVARGYVGRAAETATRFTPDSLAATPGGRAYRSGDLVRFLVDGNLLFLGRIDQQVKVRGFRIELAEIETRLAEHPAVSGVAVLAQEDRLIAYLVAEGEPPAVSALRDHLAERLPDYMLPASFLFLDALPLTSSDKIDRRALAGIELTEAPLEGPEVAPRNATEEILAGVFADVLNRGSVGVTDDFFALGGHSLLATQVISRLRQIFHREVPLRILFEAPTVASLTRAIESTAWQESSAPPIEARSERKSLPLSFAQQRLWFLDQLDPDSSAYNLPMAVRLEGRMDLPALGRAIDEVVRRHQVLRTVYREIEGEPTQRILPATHVPLPLVDVSHLAPEDRSTLARRLAADEARRPFDLARGPVVRAGVLILSAQDHMVLATLHHIASDGWSMEILNRELTLLYDAFAHRRPTPLSELPIQYADYAEWQRDWLRDEVLAAEIGHWREALAGAPAVMAMPTDRPYPAVATTPGNSCRIALPAEVAADLRALSRSNGATLFMTLLAGFEALLAHWTGESDLVVGTPIAGRNRLETEELIGFFVNTLVLRVDASGDPDFAQLVERVREVSLQAQMHQELPFEKLVEELEPERSLSHSPLFQILFAVQNMPEAAEGMTDLQASELGIDDQTAKFELSLFLEESAGGISGGLGYKTALFDETTIQRLCKRLETLLTTVAAAPDLRLSDLPALDPAELHQISSEWNDRGAPPAGRAVSLDRSPTIHGLISAQADRSPEAVALIAGGRHFSYACVDRRHRTFAAQLRNAGVGAEDRIGLLADRSPERIIAILGILAAGGAYVPLDPALPSARLATMLQDAEARVLVAPERLARLLPRFAGQVVSFDASPTSRTQPLASVPLAHSDQVAYVIFTSGSTGRPKGVMNSHQAVVNRLLWLEDLRGLEATDRVLQKTPFTFDVSVWEQFWPLITGRPLILAKPGGHRDAAYLARLIVAQRITVSHFVPSMLSAFLDEPAALTCRTLRRVIASGEALTPELVQRFASDVDASLENLYGPTEAAIEVTHQLCRPEPGTVAVPIGRPAPGCQIHLLNEISTPAAIGVTGELFIGGIQVARGYSNSPRLTAMAFLPDALGGAIGARLYRTGDLARHRPDGTIEFLGRRDHQVKIRGFRIELGEIEAVLGEHPAVREVAVLARPALAGELALHAYLSATPTASAALPEPAELRSHLEARLPGYMVPAAFSILDTLPLTASGKIDRRALGRIEPARHESQTAYVPPRTVTEELLAQTFAAALSAERVGREDNFFALGGHSLLATRLVSRVRDAFDVELPVRAIFERPTVGELAQAVQHAQAAHRPPLVARPNRQVAPLSFAQQRLWFIDQLEPGSSAYNIPLILRLQGELDLAALGHSCSEVVRRHEVLRTRFVEHQGEPVQQIDANASLPLPVIDLERLEAEDLEACARHQAQHEAMRPFDLQRGPVARTLVIRLAQDDHVLVATMHHIVSDGWSMEVLYREVGLLYESFRRGESSTLPELPIQYGDYAAWQRSWLHGDVLQAEIAHWRQRLASAPSVLELPWDRPRPPAMSFRGASCDLALDRASSARLKELARQRGATLFMVSLAGFQALLSRWSGATDLTLGTPIAGRTQLEVEGLIGFFVNTLVLRADLRDDPTLHTLVDQAREVSLDAHAHQELPFEKLVEELEPERSLSYTPLFQVLFALQNAPAAEGGGEELDGLRITPFDSAGTTAKFDLSLALEETGEEITGTLEYATDLFDRTTILRLAAHFHVLLQAAMENPDSRLSQLSLLDPAERHQLASEWNDREASLARGRGIHQLVAEQIAARPETIAILSDHTHLSYGELGRRA
ncbi:MAG: non-ribosomal peptide synthase/polyketide synthase, partial [Acidobacteriota bacterium]